MSRFRRFTISLATGYLLLGVTVIQTLASVPLALHYLSKEEFGLWALVMQLSGYLALVDLGMAGSISRILIDRKDNPSDGVYGAIIKTGLVVLVVQGAIIAVAGTLLSFWVPSLFAVPAAHQRDFQLLVAGQCLVMGVTFVGRMFNHVLQAHQRYDAWNYGLIVGVVANLSAMWVGFAEGYGLYSLLVASAASQVASTLFTLAATLRLRLFPPPGSWGRANWQTFHELFSYGREIFLLSVGLQLVNASQVIIVSRTLGLNAAAVWSIATKSFALVQQVVYRPLDFSSAGLSEMMVRGERERLLARFRDLMILTGSLAVWCGLAVALCNSAFLSIWTKGRIQWDTTNDWLMALLIIMNSVTRCYIGFTGLTKDIRAMKYIYALEGVCFVALSLVAARVWGMKGIIGSALLTNFLCSGVYGFHRTKEYFKLPDNRTLLDWLRQPMTCLLSTAAVFGLFALLGSGWGAFVQLSVKALLATFAGFVLFWLAGLGPQLRLEATQRLARWRTRRAEFSTVKPAPDQTRT